LAEAPWRIRFRAPSITLPRWARDNPDRLLYGTNATGKWEVYAWDRKIDSHRQVTDRPAGTMRAVLDPAGENIYWFDDGRGSELGVWMVEPFEGGPAREAFPDLPPAYSAGLELGRAFAIVGLSLPGRGTAVHRVGGEDKPKLLYEHPGAASLSGLSRDDSLFCLYHTEYGDSLHGSLRVMTLDGRAAADLTDGPDKQLQSMDFCEIPGDQRLLVAHQRRGMRQVLVWDPVSGAERELEIDLPGELAAAWFPDGERILVHHSHEGRGELYTYDLGSARLQRYGSPAGTIAGFAVRPDGEVWYGWNSSSSPPEVRSGDRILLRPPGEPKPAGAPYSAHNVDGVPVFVAEPPGQRPHPTIFAIHGGPTAHDTDSYNPAVQAWVDHGYAVVMVNYRGSTGYGVAWRDALVGNPGLTELEDIAKVRRWAVDSGLSDPDRIVLSGASWGGYLTLLGLGTQPDLWSLGVSGVPIADWLEQYDDVMEPLKAYDIALFGGSPEQVPERYHRSSPATYVENVRAPVLILAGRNDPRCPIRQVESYIQKLDALEKRHETYTYDAGHGSMVVDETLKQMEMRLDFVARHLGSTPPM
jgi:acetyl esterase/lipase